MASFVRQQLYFARALKSRPYMLFWLGQVISNLGNSVFAVALAWQVLLMTHSGTAMGLVLLAGSIPRVLFVLIGGVAADRLSRRTIILWSDSIRGVIVLIVVILGFTEQLQLWHLIVESLLFGIVSGFFGPARMSMTPDLVQKEDLVSATALWDISVNATQLLGPLVGGLLILLITPMGLFAVNAASFFIATCLLLLVSFSEHHVAAPSDIKDGASLEKGRASQRKGFRRVMRDMGEGFAYIRSSRWLWVSLVSSSLSNFGGAIPVLALPLLVSNVYGQGPWLLGLISSGGAVGSFIALWLVGQVKHIKRRGLVAYLAIIFGCLGTIMLGLPFPHTSAALIATLAMVIRSFGSSVFNTIWFVIIQEQVPREKLGRVSSVDTLGSIGLMPLAQGIGGVLTDSLGPATICVLSGAFCLITDVIPLFVRDIRAIK